MWLNRPKGYDGWAVLNDLDGNVANAWRAMKSCPLEVAEDACHPVHECDLHARHLWLVNNLPKLAARLMADPDYCEPKTAGWWIWGINQWIGSGWCAGEGGWVAAPDEDGVPTLTRNGGQGVSRKLPHLGDGGKGVSRKLQGDRLLWLESWFSALSDSLSKARIACGDWERICSVGTITKNGTCAVLLDPPYSLTNAVYAHDSSSVSADVRAWCERHGDNPKLRIALCGHAGEGHESLVNAGWTVEEWGKGGGYQGADDRERIWFSPACLRHGGLFV